MRWKRTLTVAGVVGIAALAATGTSVVSRTQAYRSGTHAIQLVCDHRYRNDGKPRLIVQQHGGTQRWYDADDSVAVQVCAALGSRNLVFTGPDRHEPPLTLDMLYRTRAWLRELADAYLFDDGVVE